MFMNRFIKTIRLTNKTTRTWRKGTTTFNNIINRFPDIIDSVTIFYDSTFMKTFTRTFNYGITTIAFLITLSCTDIVRHTGGTEGTVTDDWLDLIQGFALGTKTLSVEVGSRGRHIHIYIKACWHEWFRLLVMTTFWVRIFL